MQTHGARESRGEGPAQGGMVRESWGSIRQESRPEPRSPRLSSGGLTQAPAWAPCVPSTGRLCWAPPQCPLLTPAGICFRDLQGAPLMTRVALPPSPPTRGLPTAENNNVDDDHLRHDHGVGARGSLCLVACTWARCRLLQALLTAAPRAPQRPLYACVLGSVPPHVLSAWNGPIPDLQMINPDTEKGRDWPRTRVPASARRRLGAPARPGPLGWGVGSQAPGPGHKLLLDPESPARQGLLLSSGYPRRPHSPSLGRPRYGAASDRPSPGTVADSRRQAVGTRQSPGPSCSVISHVAGHVCVIG